MLKITEANSRHLAQWDDFVESSVNGTIFHRQRFLSYHGKKFSGKEKHLIVLNGNNPWAQISLAVNDKKAGPAAGGARSPYAGSYGGFVFNAYPSYAEGKELAALFINYLRQINISTFTLTPPLACCAASPVDTFYFNLLENGFTSLKRDISNVFCFKKDQPIDRMVSQRARRGARKAQTAGITTIHKGNVEHFWKTLTATYRKLGVDPTHTLEEYKLLMRLFPEQIYVDVAYQNKTPVAGIACITVNPLVRSSFYLCQDPQYQDTQALSLLVMQALGCAQEEGFSYFDFGTSSANMVARENLFAFKENFSKIGFFRETFQWKKQAVTKKGKT